MRKTMILVVLGLAFPASALAQVAPLQVQCPPGYAWNGYGCFPFQQAQPALPGWQQALGAQVPTENCSPAIAQQDAKKGAADADVGPWMGYGILAGTVGNLLGMLITGLVANGDRAPATPSRCLHDALYVSTFRDTWKGEVDAVASSRAWAGGAVGVLLGTAIWVAIYLVMWNEAEDRAERVMRRTTAY